MSRVDALRHRVSVFLHPRRYARELEAERRFHLDLEAMQQRHVGAAEDEAEFTARRQFGNVTYYGEETRHMTSLRISDALMQDLRYAVRTLRKSPGFTLAAVFTLALGIGATTAVFSMVNALLLRPLPVAQPDRLFNINEQRVGALVRWMGQEKIPYGRFLSYREGTRQVFSGLAAQNATSFSLRAGSEPATTVSGALVSANYFDVLGVRPMLGRFFSRDDEPAVVLSHRLWQTRFAGDRNVIGQTIYLNSRPYAVAGVAPAGFSGTTALMTLAVWVPVKSAPLSGDMGVSGDMGSWVAPFGRLRPGVTPAYATAVVDAVAKRVPPDEPQSRVRGARLEPMTSVPASEHRGMVRFLGMVLAAAALVLLIASANIAGMLLARAVARRREMAVRLAVGAGRGRLIWQLLTESAVLFLLGGVGGFLLALWLARLLAAWVPELTGGAVLDVTPDLRVLGFALVLTAATGILFGLAPALRASRAELVPALKDGAGRGSRSARGRSIFVVAQLALSVVLLVATGLFVRTLRSALAVDPGVDPDGVVVASVDLAPNGYDEARGHAFYSSLIEHVSALPGVESAGLARYVLLSGNVETSDIEPAEVGPKGRTRVNAVFDVVSPGYFRALSSPLVAGRVLSAADDERGTPVVVVNQTLARRLWPDENPLGKHVRTLDHDWEVVGVLRDGRYESIDEQPQPFMVFELGQRSFMAPLLGPTYWLSMTLYVRTRIPAAQVIQQIRGQVRALDPNVAVAYAEPLTDVIDRALFPQRVAARLIGIFGFVGLLLAAIGIYGVLAYHVAQRTREFGIRLALGARGGDVVRSVMRRGALLIVMGIAVGLLAAAAVTRLVSGLLYGISPLDPVTFVVAPLVLIVVALVACWIPARRATRVDPVSALRAE
ncbi:MAG TPA: ABC transporter permease [Gemmatimonadaceae bacterium]|nr:ABC transporter permease [Gemmatimonadaceae bacterium]